MRGWIKMAKQFTVKVNGKSFDVVVEEKAGNAVVSQITPKEEVVETPAFSGEASGTPVVAPMGGMVKDILVKVGDKVADGDVVAIVEVMKMDTEVTAEAAGVVESIQATKGTNLESGATIVTIK
jgi:oxaloacetate decarboxylase alpha subunit